MVENKVVLGAALVILGVIGLGFLVTRNRKELKGEVASKELLFYRLGITPVYEYEIFCEDGQTRKTTRTGVSAYFKEGDKVIVTINIKTDAIIHMRPA